MRRGKARAARPCGGTALPTALCAGTFTCAAALIDARLRISAQPGRLVRTRHVSRDKFPEQSRIYSHRGVSEKKETDRLKDKQSDVGNVRGCLIELLSRVVKSALRSSLSRNDKSNIIAALSAVINITFITSVFLILFFLITHRVHFVRVVEYHSI